VTSLVIGLAFVCLWRYSNTVASIRKVSTILCRSYQTETIAPLLGFPAIWRLEKFLWRVSNMSEMTAKATLPACPVETTLTLIGDKWKVLILRDLMPGTKRFGELKKSVGNVSQKVLTAQLRAMEESGLVNRKVYAEVPPRVEYSLTELGKSLKPILDSMWAWGEDYKKQQELADA
jgi:DNA-binding HxlR family transcriptional regulator